jgi:phosphatidylglycerol:prolipoprotein diacylglycerol transferase
MFPLHADVLYPLAMGVAALTGVACFVLSAWRAGRSPARAALGAGFVLVASLLGGHLFWVVEQADGWSRLGTPGFRHPGVVLGLIVSVPIARRLFDPNGMPLRRILDWTGPSTAIALAVARLGCLAAGCCFGTPSDLPWAIRFPEFSQAANVHHFLGWVPANVDGSLPVHPLQLYFLAWSLSVALFLLWWDARRSYDGQVFVLFLALQESGKYLLESLRETALGSTPRVVPEVSLALALVAWTVLLVTWIVGAWRVRATAAATSHA